MATSTEEALPQPDVAPLPPVLPRPRRWPRRLLIALNIFVALCLIGVASAYVYVRAKFGDIPRLALPSISESPGKEMNVLLVGSDTRADLSDPGNFGGTS